MAEPIIPRAGAHTSPRYQGYFGTPSAQLVELVDGLGRAARLIDLIQWVERARALATEVVTAAISDQALREALAAHDLQLRDAAFCTEESGGLHQVLTEAAGLVLKAQQTADLLRWQAPLVSGEQA